MIDDDDDYWELFLWWLLYIYNGYYSVANNDEWSIMN